MIDKVLEEISLDIDWRNEELKQIILISDTLSDKELKFFLKGCIPLLYAHWEGFVVSSLKIVFKYLNCLKLNSNDYSEIYLTTAYEQTLKSLDDSTGFDKRRKHLTNLYKGFKEEVKLNEKIDTKSNLNYTVLEEICKKINIDINSFEIYKNDLNELVNIRNFISHGDGSYNFEQYEDIESYLELLKNLMLDLQSQLQDLLKQEKYKRGN